MGSLELKYCCRCRYVSYWYIPLHLYVVGKSATTIDRCGLRHDLSIFLLALVKFGGHGLNCKRQGRPQQCALYCVWLAGTPCIFSYLRRLYLGRRRNYRIWHFACNVKQSSAAAAVPHLVQQ